MSAALNVPTCIDAPGLYDNHPAALYHSGPGVSKSNLDLIHSAPALIDWSRDCPKDDECKAAVDLGTAFHSYLLEPDAFERDYVTEFSMPPYALTTADDFKTALKERGILFKAADAKPALAKLLLDSDPDAPVGDALRQEWEKGIHGRKVLSLTEGKKLRLMRESVMAHPFARKLIEADGFTERSYYWNDPITGELCRSRHDRSIPRMGITVDLKSTADIGKFSRSIVEYRYHVQDAFYSDGHHAAVGERLRAFLFLVVSTTRDRSRYPTRIFSLSNEDRNIGRAEYQEDMETYAKCRRSGIWPGVEPIALPDWFRAKSEIGRTYK